MRAAGKEREIKLAIRKPASVRRGLRRLGFRVVRPRRLERNWVFDSPRQRLRRRGCLLRLRSVDGRHWLTCKGPTEFSPGYKVRDEWEMEVADPAAVRAVLGVLGFAPWFRYEKFRTIYAGRGRWRGGEVMLDETPIGTYLELEGGRGWIRRVARALGAGREMFITRSYAALYADWCRRRRRPFRHMVFRRRVSS